MWARIGMTSTRCRQEATKITRMVLLGHHSQQPSAIRGVIRARTMVGGGRGRGGGNGIRGQHGQGCVLSHVDTPSNIGKASAGRLNRGARNDSSVSRTRVTKDKTAGIDTKARPGTFIILTEFREDGIR
jgi:hypothetical protein